MISIDFWNTIVIAHSNGEKRHQARLSALVDLAGEYNLDLTVDQIKKAHAHASDKFDEIWLGTHRTPTSRELVGFTLDFLGIHCSDDEAEKITRIYQESLLDGPPHLAPGVGDALEKLASGHKLAIISDTMFSPGRVLKDYLDSQKIGPFFSAYAFSDEVGVSKPHEKMYRKVLGETGDSAGNSCHIGDLQQTDIAGAKALGMRAILYTGINRSDEKSTTADHVCSDWKKIPGLVG